jgi:hypothetical protein
MLLYTWAIPHFDKEGFMEGDPITLKARVVPRIQSGYDLDTIKIFLEELVEKNLWIIHETPEGTYIQDPRFREFQVPNPKEAPSKILPIIKKLKKPKGYNQDTIKNVSGDNQDLHSGSGSGSGSDKYSSDSNEVGLALLLYEKILKNDPKAKKPDIQKWAKDMDLLLRVDKRDPKEVEKIIVWCQEHEFWKSNILSPAKLRKQYPTLRLQMNRQPKYGEVPDDW